MIVDVILVNAVEINNVISILFCENQENVSMYYAMTF